MNGNTVEEQKLHRCELFRCAKQYTHLVFINQLCAIELNFKQKAAHFGRKFYTIGKLSTLYKYNTAEYLIKCQLENTDNKTPVTSATKYNGAMELVSSVFVSISRSCQTKAYYLREIKPRIVRSQRV